jgi:predicted nucleic acid-binding Zn ribbon protein
MSKKKREKNQKILIYAIVIVFVLGFVLPMVFGI